MAGDSHFFVRTLETSTIEKPLEVVVLTMREGMRRSIMLMVSMVTE